MSSNPGWEVGKILLILVGVPITLGSCGRTASSDSPAHTAALMEIKAASAAWDEAHNAGDLDALMQLYSESAVSMPYSRPALEGRAAIEADFRDFFAGFEARHRTAIVSLEVAGGWAIERGEYELHVVPKAGGEATDERGKHLVVRKQVNGAWKIQWEIWNTDAAPVP